MTQPISLWAERIDERPPGPILELPARVDVAIVGGGMMGASTAWWLAQTGADVLVLDRRAPLMGASGRNGGIMTVGMELGFTQLSRMHGKHVAVDLTLGTQKSEQRIIEFLTAHAPDALERNSGFLSMWTSGREQDDAVQEAAALQALSLESRLLDHDEVAEVLGTEVADRIIGGSYTSFDTSVDPGAYVIAMMREAAKLGARFGYPVQVNTVAKQSDGLRVSTSRGEIIADQVVVATNNETEHLLPRSHAFLSYQRDTVAVVRPRNGNVKTSWMVSNGTDYGRPLGADRHVIGGFGTSEAVDAFATETTFSLAEVRSKLDSFMQRTFPSQVRSEIECYWAGVMAYTGDALPVVGPWPGTDGLWIIVGFGGDGLSFSQWLPPLLAEAISARSVAPIPDYLGVERFLRV
jgi:gamma-glutamylputrescine oxidase